MISYFSNDLGLRAPSLKEGFIFDTVKGKWIFTTSVFFLRNIQQIKKRFVSAERHIRLCNMCSNCLVFEPLIAYSDFFIFRLRKNSRSSLMNSNLFSKVLSLILSSYFSGLYNAHLALWGRHLMSKPRSKIQRMIK